jgi:Raf kinase inhibitor-like YbhB/YbcL family protein
MMKSLVVATAIIALSAGTGLAQPAGERAELLTINTVAAPDAVNLTVASPAFEQGGAIPLANSAYGENLMPGLSWTPGPEGTQSYLVIVEDPDAPTAQPFLHWIAGDIPADVTSLPAGMGAEGPGESFQSGVRGQAQYFGPRPPSGVHNYNFQVFALDRMLDLDSGASLADVKTRMEGHVLASGVLAGAYAAPE